MNVLADLIQNSNYIVFFGGAGVSTESGVPDFRSVDGLYNQHFKYPPEEILSSNFFYTKPTDFYDFYYKKIICYNPEPNAAHLALAKLEHLGKLKAVITQNIDGLHQLAGSKNVYELHGTTFKNHCIKCNKEYTLKQIKKMAPLPKCTECGSIIKPDVTLYGEALSSQCMLNAISHIQNADLLIVGGTSLAVYPAASLIDYYTGKNLVLINKEKTSRDNLASHIIREPIGKTFSQINSLLKL